MIEENDNYKVMFYFLSVSESILLSFLLNTTITTNTIFNIIQLNI